MRKVIRRHLPDPAKLKEHPVFRLLGESLLHPRLWHLNRHSVASAVAIGMFCGLIPGPLQMLTAAFLCVFFRANLPVALASTWYTNPLTIVPLYIVAFWLGELVTGTHGAFIPPPHVAWDQIGVSLHAYWHWMLGLGMPLAIGLVVLACLLAALGYALVKTLWRLHIIRAYKRRNLRC